MNKLRLMECFGGIGACTKALKRIGIDVEIVDYVEIDKYAVKSYNAINGTNFEPQDITKWDKDINVDLIMHGSPCQDFSLAGKQAGGDIGSGTRSSLMYETLRIVSKLNPKYVVWENVKNILSKKHKHNFDNYIVEMEELGYDSYYQVLNAKDYGIPQNRERVYTISIRKDIDRKFAFPRKKNLSKMPIDFLEKSPDKKYDLTEKNKQHYQRKFGSKGKEIDLFNPIPTLTSAMGTGGGNIPYFTFPPKQELKLRLKDMLEEVVDEKYYLKDYQIENILKSNYHTNQPRIQQKDYCDTLCARDWKDPKCIQVANLKGGKWNKINESCRRVYSEEGISPTIHTCQGGNTEPKVQIKNATKKGYLEAKIGDGIDISSRMQYHRGTVQKDMVQTLDTQATKGVIDETFRIRKLTPKECWRLMGFDDEDFEKAQAVPMSNTQLYKQAGNSIVVNVLEEIFKKLL